MHGREENIFKGAGEGFQQFYVLTFPSILKNERKEEEKDMQGREENIFKGGSTMLKPFPAP